MTDALAAFLGALCGVLLAALLSALFGFLASSLRTRFAYRLHRPQDARFIVSGPDSIEPADEVPSADVTDDETAKAAIVSEWERTRPVSRTGLHVVNYPVMEDEP